MRCLKVKSLWLGIPIITMIVLLSSWLSSLSAISERISSENSKLRAQLHMIKQAREDRVEEHVNASRAVDKVDLVVGICSALGNYPKRQAIRETWGKFIQLLGNAQGSEFKIVKLFFIVGGTGSSELLEEKAEYGDIALLDVADGYKYLPAKVRRGIQYAVWRWDFQWFLKGDDDSFVHLPRLFKELDKISPIRKAWGRLHQERAGNKMGTEGAWGEHYWNKKFGHAMFPPYFFGAGYAISYDIASALADTRIPWAEKGCCEDVVMGIWLSPLDVDLVNSNGVNIHGRGRIISHYQTPVDMKELWDDFRHGEEYNEAFPTLFN